MRTLPSTRPIPRFRQPAMPLGGPAYTFARLLAPALPFVLPFVLAALASYAAAEATDAPTFHGDVLPIFTRSCNGCHNPEKFDAKLDLTTYEATLKGGETERSFTPNDPTDSILMDMISGEEPAMPKEAAPLSAEEIATIARWIESGATEGTPVEAPAPASLPPGVSPAIPALAWAPDGSALAVTGYREVVLRDGAEALEAGPGGPPVAGRLPSTSPRIEALAFTADGSRLVASGGAPARFGEIQVWDVASRELLRAYRIGKDVLYGVAVSPEGTRAAFGMPDKTLRMISLIDGQELLKFENHSDWVLHAAFTVKGDRILSGSRDMAMKLIDAVSGQFIDDINNPLDEVVGFARHPRADIVAYGGMLGIARTYAISDNQKRTAGRIDTNRMTEFERLPGAVQAVEWSPDGGRLAIGGRHDEVRVHDASRGNRVATLAGHRGAVFALAWKPDGARLATGGFEGIVRLFDPADGALRASFPAAPEADSGEIAAR